MEVCEERHDILVSVSDYYSDLLCWGFDQPVMISKESECEFG